MATKSIVEVPFERQSAAQAAAFVELDALPGALAEPDAAVRVGRTAAKDEALHGVRSLGGIRKLGERQLLANYGRSEGQWATAHQRRRSRGAPLVELLSYARQLIAVNDRGEVCICLMGHAGRGPSVPLWLPAPDVVLTLQPNDLVLRFELDPGMGEFVDDLSRYT